MSLCSAGSRIPLAAWLRRFWHAVHTAYLRWSLRRHGWRWGTPAPAPGVAFATLKLTALLVHYGLMPPWSVTAGELLQLREWIEPTAHLFIVARAGGHDGYRIRFDPTLSTGQAEQLRILLHVVMAGTAQHPEYGDQLALLLEQPLWRCRVCREGHWTQAAWADHMAVTHRLPAEWPWDIWAVSA